MTHKLPLVQASVNVSLPSPELTEYYLERLGSEPEQFPPLRHAPLIFTDRAAFDRAVSSSIVGYYQTSDGDFHFVDECVRGIATTAVAPSDISFGFRPSELMCAKCVSSGEGRYVVFHAWWELLSALSAMHDVYAEVERVRVQPSRESVDNLMRATVLAERVSEELHCLGVQETAVAELLRADAVGAEGSVWQWLHASVDRATAIAREVMSSSEFVDSSGLTLAQRFNVLAAVVFTVTSSVTNSLEMRVPLAPDGKAFAGDESAKLVHVSVHVLNQLRNYLDYPPQTGDVSLESILRELFTEIRSQGPRSVARIPETLVARPEGISVQRWLELSWEREFDELSSEFIRVLVDRAEEVVRDDSVWVDVTVNVDDLPIKFGSFYLRGEAFIPTARGRGPLDRVRVPSSVAGAIHIEAIRYGSLKSLTFSSVDPHESEDLALALTLLSTDPLSEMSSLPLCLRAVKEARAAHLTR